MDVFFYYRNDEIKRVILEINDIKELIQLNN